MHIFSCTLLYLVPLSSQTEKCLNRDKMCDGEGGGDNILGIFQAVGSGRVCRQLCEDTGNCEVFTYFGQNSFPVLNTCMVFSTCSVLHHCTDCLTAPVLGDMKALLTLITLLM